MGKSRRDHRIISTIADKLDEYDPNIINEALYGYTVKHGNELIDQLIMGVETQFMDWKWDDRKFQSLMNKIYKGKPPKTQEELIAELQKSVQHEDLKEKLAGALGTGLTRREFMKTAAAAAATAAMPAAAVAVTPSAPSKKTLTRGSTYDIVYTNFQGKKLTFKGVTFTYRTGKHAIFTSPNTKRGPWHVSAASELTFNTNKRQQYQTQMANNQIKLQNTPQNWLKTRAKFQRAINWNSAKVAKFEDRIKIKDWDPRISLIEAKIVNIT